MTPWQTFRWYWTRWVTHRLDGTRRGAREYERAVGVDLPRAVRLERFRRLAEGGVVTGSSLDSDSVPMVLSGGCIIPVGTDPYRWTLAPDECVLSAKTGKCMRDHTPSGLGHVDWSWFIERMQSDRPSDTGDQT